MRQTEGWWICHECGHKTHKAGKKGAQAAMFDHRKVCKPLACFFIQQVEQRKGA